MGDILIKMHTLQQDVLGCLPAINAYTIPCLFRTVRVVNNLVTETVPKWCVIFVDCVILRVSGCVACPWLFADGNNIPHPKTYFVIKYRGCWNDLIYTRFTADAVLFLIGTLGTNLNEIWIKAQSFSFKKINLKMSTVKWQLFRLSLSVFTTNDEHSCHKHLWPDNL